MKINGEKLKELRKGVNMTQQQLADASGVSIATIKNVESGRRNFPMGQDTKIARALGIEVDEIEVKDTIVMACMTNKGGAGKTSVLAGLSYALANNFNQKILLIDTDAQRNLSMHFGLANDDERNFYKAFVYNEDIRNHIINTQYSNIDFVTSHYALAKIETELMSMRFREERVSNILEGVVEEGTYDIILIDTNPTLGMLNTSVMIASDEILIPVETSMFGVEGLNVFMEYYMDIKRDKPNLNIAGIIFNKVDLRKSVTFETQEIVTRVFGEVLLKTVIPIDSSIEKSQFAKVPVGDFSDRSRASVEFINLAKEVLDIVKK